MSRQSRCIGACAPLALPMAAGTAALGLHGLRHAPIPWTATTTPAFAGSRATGSPTKAWCATSSSRPGALLKLQDVEPRLIGQSFDLPPVDPAFNSRIASILTGNMDDYGLAVLDLSDPAKPRYAEHRADHRQNVGSVGKLVVALALFQALADLYPDDVEARRRVLKTTRGHGRRLLADGQPHGAHVRPGRRARSRGARCASATKPRCTNGSTGCSRRARTRPPAW